MCPNIQWDGVKSFWVGTKQCLYIFTGELELKYNRELNVKFFRLLFCFILLLFVHLHSVMCKP